MELTFEYYEFIEQIPDDDPPEPESPEGLPLDHRLDLLSRSTRVIISDRFHDCVDDAIVHALRIVGLVTPTPAWAHELVSLVRLRITHPNTQLCPCG